MQKDYELSWAEIYQRIHLIKLSIGNAESTADILAFIANTIDAVEQGLLSHFDDIAPQIGDEFDPLFHEQIGYVQNNKISKVISNGKIKDGTVIFKAKVKR